MNKPATILTASDVRVHAMTSRELLALLDRTMSALEQRDALADVDDDVFVAAREAVDAFRDEAETALEFRIEEHLASLPRQDHSLGFAALGLTKAVRS